MPKRFETALFPSMHESSGLCTKVPIVYIRRRLDKVVTPEGAFTLPENVIRSDFGALEFQKDFSIKPGTFHVLVESSTLYSEAVISSRYK